MTLKKRLFAFMYHNLLSDQGQVDMDQPFTRNVRVPLLAQARGKVLEIGVGDGGNLPLYPSGVELTLLDQNPYLLAHAVELAKKLDISAYQTELASAENIPFSTASFDTVVSTHVLCSVHDQSRVLAEIKRVLKPGGRFIFLEHVMAEPGTTKHTFQRVINPAWKFVGDGCQLTRDTGAVIRAAGFRQVDLQNFIADFPSIVSPISAA